MGLHKYITSWGIKFSVIYHKDRHGDINIEQLEFKSKKLRNAKDPWVVINHKTVSKRYMDDIF